MIVELPPALPPYGNGTLPAGIRSRLVDDINGLRVHILEAGFGGATERPLKSIIGDVAFLKTLKPATFADSQFGVPTVTDIIAELEKPGRDPRPEFKTATFQEGVEAISDLERGMQLEGVVTNVTAFGAFVDVGVHQDGLVHISELSDRFVKDPREVVKAGDVVKVRVKDVDVARKRIAGDDASCGEKPPVCTTISPCATAFTASVTTIEGSRRNATPSPFTSPNATPQATPTGIASVSPSAPQPVAAVAIIPPTATTHGTERSIWPSRITIIAPVAITPRKDATLSCCSR